MWPCAKIDSYKFDPILDLIHLIVTLFKCVPVLKLIHPYVTQF